MNIKLFKIFKINLFFFVNLFFIQFNYCNSEWKIWEGDLDWWQQNIIYQIYPKSFMDSDGDGSGDLKGIESKLDHFVDAGIKIIWLSPIYSSPMADLGYDISNFTDIDPSFGTMDDFKSLINALKERGMYLLLDFVPNHTSDEHPWFQKSVLGIEPYDKYYVWGKETQYSDLRPPYPNNWLSLFGGSGWTFRKERNQFYYHQFNLKQPDLNTYNKKVQQELKDVMKFWLDLGVDGFRVDAVRHLREDATFKDEVCDDGTFHNCTFVQMIHNYTMDLLTTYEVIYDWRKFLDEYKENATEKHTRVMFTEAYTDVDKLMLYFTNGTVEGAHSPFNFYLLYPSFQSNTTVYKALIDTLLKHIPDGHWPNWVTGNHDNHRVATKHGDEMVDAFYMMAMLLPGTAVTYQGEELGQPDTKVRDDQIRDPNNNGLGTADVRDPQRGPYLWDETENSGFTTCKQPWEPIYPSYWKINLNAQKSDPSSHYNKYKQIVSLRSEQTILRGDAKLYNVSAWVLAIARTLPGNDSYVIVVNFGSEREVILLSESVPKLPSKMAVAVGSINSGYITGDIINTKVEIDKDCIPLVLRPKASVVLTSNLDYQPTTSSPNETTGTPDNSTAVTGNPSNDTTEKPPSGLSFSLHGQRNYTGLLLVLVLLTINTKFSL